MQTSAMVGRVYMQTVSALHGAAGGGATAVWEAYLWQLSGLPSGVRLPQEDPLKNSGTDRICAKGSYLVKGGWREDPCNWGCCGRNLAQRARISTCKQSGSCEMCSESTSLLYNLYQDEECKLLAAMSDQPDF